MDSLEENAITSNSSHINYLAPFPWGDPLMASVNAINFILGVPSNGFILWLMVTRTGTVNALEFFSLNLTVFEVLFGLSNICLFAYLFHKTDLVLFKAFEFFSAFMFTGRPLFQTCICLERYLAVIHPVLFLRLKSLQYRVTCCTVVWLLTFGACFMNALILDANDALQHFTMSIYVLLFSVKLFCCLSVLRALRQPGPGKQEREKEGSNNVKMKALKVILIITVSTIMTYLPFVITFILHDYISPLAFQKSYLISSCVAVMTGFVHPFLYLHRTGKLPCITI